MTKKIDIGRYVAPIIEQVLEAQGDLRLFDKQVYKLSMDVSFDIAGLSVQAMHVDNVKLKPMNAAKKLICPE